MSKADQRRANDGGEVGSATRMPLNAVSGIETAEQCQLDLVIDRLKNPLRHRFRPGFDSLLSPGANALL